MAAAPPQSSNGVVNEPLSPTTGTAFVWTPPREAVAFRGAVVSLPQLGTVTISSPQSLLVVDRATGRVAITVDVGEPAKYGVVAAFVATLPRSRVVTLTPTQILMPGLVDGHAHAPQHSFAGNGLDLPLLEWLETYTFPAEAAFADVAHARRVYDAAVARHLRAGSTTVSYFGTIHRAATLELVDACERRGQRAHVGKVSMDVNAPAYYVEASADAAADAAETFCRAVLDRNDANAEANAKAQAKAKAKAKAAPPAAPRPEDEGPHGRPAPPLVTPTVIPRFAPSCSARLLARLGALSATLDLPVHTHLSENRAECEWVRLLFPGAKGYADVYRVAGLLHRKAYFAHCCHCDAAERGLVRTGGAGVVTCPTSNFVVGRAQCDVRAWLDEGVDVALGTDVAGGWSTSVLVALRHVIVASRIVAERDADPRKALTEPEALYLATRGGAAVLGLADEVGDLTTPGFLFDALLVECAGSEHAAYDSFDDVPHPGAAAAAVSNGRAPQSASPHRRPRLARLFEQFLWNGDDRNILDVYVAGRRVAGARTPGSFSVGGGAMSAVASRVRAVWRRCAPDTAAAWLDTALVGTTCAAAVAALVLTTRAR